jgi:hypothetical protein
VLDLLTGRARRMKLDWHIIRNPGQKELQDVLIDRGSLEADFFRSVEPWNSTATISLEDIIITTSTTSLVP